MAGAKDKRLEGIFSEAAPETSPEDGAPPSGVVHWFARETADGSMRTRRLDATFRAVGATATFPRGEFFERFNLEPELYYKYVSQRLMQGDMLRRGDKLAEAGTQYRSVLEIDEDNLRANFGVGMVYLSLGKEAKAREAFDKLASIDEMFDPEQKHIFNELGISLRKRGMHDLTLKYYSRALELEPRDEHIHFNIARCRFEMGRYDEMFRHLRTAFELNPDVPEFRQFLEYITRKRLFPADEGTRDFLHGFL